MYFNKTWKMKFHYTQHLLRIRYGAETDFLLSAFLLSLVELLLMLTTHNLLRRTFSYANMDDYLRLATDIWRMRSVHQTKSNRSTCPWTSNIRPHCIIRYLNIVSLQLIRYSPCWFASFPNRSRQRCSTISKKRTFLFVPMLKEVQHVASQSSWTTVGYRIVFFAPFPVYAISGTSSVWTSRLFIETSQHAVFQWGWTKSWRSPAGLSVQEDTMAPRVQEGSRVGRTDWWESPIWISELRGGTGRSSCNHQ